MMYLVLDVQQDQRDWAWRRLIEAEEWEYYCYFDPMNTTLFSENYVEERIDSARWERKRAVETAKRWNVACDTHIFQKNERGHSICRKCHHFSILEASL